MFKMFKRTTLDPLSVSMVGVKLADRVLVVGCRDPKLIASLAIKAGLTGRTCAIDPAEPLVREAERVTLAEGALVEFTTGPLTHLPYEPATFDVVVLRDVVRTGDPPDPRAIAAESNRVLRPGGRCMAIDGLGSTKGWLRARSTPANPAVATTVTDALTSAGFVAVRTLAEREGVVFLEAMKKADAGTNRESLKSER
jgi:ubiquinone/menaquinone biosynthesis C-methylase UbiE